MNTKTGDRLAENVADPEALFRDLCRLMSVGSAALFELLELCELNEASAAVVAIADLCNCGIRDMGRIAEFLGLVRDGLSNTS